MEYFGEMAESKCITKTHTQNNDKFKLCMDDLKKQIIKSY